MQSYEGCSYIQSDSLNVNPGDVYSVYMKALYGTLTWKVIDFTGQTLKRGITFSGRPERIGPFEAVSSGILRLVLSCVRPSHEGYCKGAGYLYSPAIFNRGMRRAGVVSGDMY